MSTWNLADPADRRAYLVALREQADVAYAWMCGDESLAILADLLGVPRQDGEARDVHRSRVAKAWREWRP